MQGKADYGLRKEARVRCARAGRERPHMTRTLYLIRALHFDPVAQHLAQVLTQATGAPVVFVCDESRGVTDVGPYEKISLTPARLKTLGLKNAPDDWGWFWGDVCYYAALARYADYDFYTLIESDVFFSQTAAQAFVDALDSRPEHAIAGRLKPRARTACGGAKTPCPSKLSSKSS